MCSANPRPKDVGLDFNSAGDSTNLTQTAGFVIVHADPAWSL